MKKQMLVYFYRIQKLTPPLNAYSELEKMLALRAMGFSYTVLSETFNVPKLTIRYLCRRFGLDEKTVVTTIVRQPATTKKPTYNYSEEKINPGKTYAQYVREEQERKRRKAMEC